MKTEEDQLVLSERAHSISMIEKIYYKNDER